MRLEVVAGVVVELEVRLGLWIRKASLLLNQELCISTQLFKRFG